MRDRGMMGTGRAAVAVALVLLTVLFSVPVCIAETTDKDAPPKSGPFSVSGKLLYLFRSHTSYEFGNPFDPYQEPLSRLEFPLDTWWGGLEVKLNYPRFSLNLEGLTNLTQNAHGRFKDSDWDDNTRPDEKTIYSTSDMRVAPSYMVRFDADLEIADWLRLPSWLSLRPVAGVRWQKFHVVSHDGVQYDLTGNTEATSLPGEGIRFKQEYWHYFIGLRSSIDLSQLTGISSFAVTMQGDLAYVEGANEDNHLLRPGRRFTYETTYGHAWHCSLGLTKGLGKNLTVRLAGDYLAIDTHGGIHRLKNDPLNLALDVTNGIKVWSDQASVSLALQYNF